MELTADIFFLQETWIFYYIDVPYQKKKRFSMQTFLSYAIFIIKRQKLIINKQKRFNHESHDKTT